MTHACHSVCQTACPLKNEILLHDINYTRQQLENAVAEAEKFHADFLATTQINEAMGLVNPVLPQWAPKALRKLGITGAVLEKIGSMAFAKRRPEDVSPFCNYIEACLAEQKPLQFRVGFGPLKNIRYCGPEQSPDLAEYLTFIQLARLMHSVSAVYPHGVRVQIVPDDLRAMQANKCLQCHVHCYIGGLQKMVKLLSFDKWMYIEFGQSALFEEYRVYDYFVAAEEQLQHWRKNSPEEFSLRWSRALENAQKNLNPETDNETNEAIEGAAWRYLVTHQSEVLSGLWGTHDAFPLRYGKHSQNYQLYTFGTKKTKLPWQISLPGHLLKQKPNALNL